MRRAAITSLGIVLALFFLCGAPVAHAQDAGPAKVDDAARFVVFEQFGPVGGT